MTEANPKKPPAVRIDYVEFAVTDIPKAKRFFESAFGWDFTDYGDNYSSFNDGRLAGGFYKADESSSGGPLVVMYSDKLEEVEARVRSAGGAIVKEIFEFPGGRRFHFSDPVGNVLAVWSDK